MKITIVGGSKGTGAELASLAHGAGHEVTVVSRTGRAPEGAGVVTGDAADPTIAATAITGADAVVITVGGAKGVPLHRTAVTRSVIGAMQEAGVSRIIVQSSLGAGDSAGQLPGPLRMLTKLVLAKPLADHNEQESLVVGSGLDWTIVRPTGLTNKPATGNWRAFEVQSDGKLQGSIPRGDLAALMFDILGDDSAIGKALGVSG